MSNMILHCGGFEVKTDDLIDYIPPEKTRSYQPLSHFDFASMLLEAAEKERLSVVEQKWAISHEGNRMYGLVNFDRELNGHQLGIIVRNSFDRSLAAGIAAGNRNMICDNTALSGSYRSMIKHTNNVNYWSAIQEAMGTITFDMEEYVKKIEYLKMENISIDDAKLLLFDAAFNSGLISTAHVVDILDEFVEPSFDEFAAEPLNKYRLFQAVTHSAKIEEKANRFEKRLVDASTLFDLN